MLKNGNHHNYDTVGTMHEKNNESILFISTFSKLLP